MPTVKDQSSVSSLSAGHYQQLLASLHRLHGLYRRTVDVRDLFAAVVEELRRLTDSPHGGGAEVVRGEGDTLSVTLRAALYPKDAPTQWLDTLYDEVLRGGEAREAATPCALGIPVFCGGELVAILAVAADSDFTVAKG